MLKSGDVIHPQGDMNLYTKRKPITADVLITDINDGSILFKCLSELTRTIRGNLETKATTVFSGL